MFKFHKSGNQEVAEFIGDMVISSVEDSVDLLGEASMGNCTGVIISEKNLHPDFFRLHTGLAGEVLQKFSNYRVKLAITGDFTKYKSKSLQDFIRECNRGNSIFFVKDSDSGIARIVSMGLHTP